MKGCDCDGCRAAREFIKQDAAGMKPGLVARLEFFLLVVGILGGLFFLVSIARG